MKIVVGGRGQGDYILKTQELRDTYLKFFESKGHKIMHSASLVPAGDPTLLLTAAGMVPFKPYFLGTLKPEYTRVTTCQKCIRTPDIENVGKTARHGTFFEMLGNFSFGDYFKEEAISWAWEFLTQNLGFNPNDLWITVYHDDDEAFEIWNKKIGVPKERIVRKGKEDNFWEIGVGPCGPCSEIHVDRGPECGCGKPDCGLDCGCDRFMEIWNLVFIQFFKNEDGEYVPLQRKGIDTGMGLERVAALLQGSTTIFDADETKMIRDAVCDLANVKYGEDYTTDVAVRVITDHARSSTFMVSDGVFPTNEGRGYVLRRLLRRGMRFGRLLGIKENVMSHMANVVIDVMKVAYPELERDRERILGIIELEEERFRVALEQGTALLQSLIERAKEMGSDTISGEDAFKLYDTFGFPYELTLDMAEEHGLGVDKDGFDIAMSRQRERARSARADNSYMDEKSAFYKAALGDSVSEFVGYTTLNTDSVITVLIDKTGSVDVLSEGQEGEIVLNVTPFYASSGGQINDEGYIKGTDGALAQVVSVSDPLKTAKVHTVKVVKGQFRVKDMVSAEVDESRRNNVRRNHSATHLIHAALRQVLGDHIQQAGSLVEPERLRFDFTHFKAMSYDEKKAVERLANSWIIENLPVETVVTSVSEAKAKGAMALFDEKYGEEVRMVCMGDHSLELCGGTHVSRTGDIGLVKIVSEGGIASGVRRIEAVTGMFAHDLIDREEEDVMMMSEKLKVTPAMLPERVEKLTKEVKDLEKEVSSLKSKMSSGSIDEMAEKGTTVGAFKVVSARVDGCDTDAMRDLADKVRNKISSGAVILASVNGEKVSFVVALTQDAVKKGLHAGKTAKFVSELTGGGGGGRPDMALAGGKDISKVDEALAAGSKMVCEELAK